MLQGTPLPAIFSHHSIYWMYLYSLQINWEIKNIFMQSAQILSLIYYIILFSVYFIFILFYYVICNIIYN
jgi:hypothetical protein